jgi:hypothetical protein
MVFDLRGALLGRAEVESLAPLLGVEAQALVDRIASEPDDAILISLPETARAWYDEARIEARRQLIEESGDPTPGEPA